MINVTPAPNAVHQPMYGVGGYFMRMNQVRTCITDSRCHLRIHQVRT